MNCLTPDVKVPDHFRDWDSNVTATRERRSVERTSVFLDPHSKHKRDTSEQLSTASTPNRFPRAVQDHQLSTAVKHKSDEEVHVLNRFRRTVQESDIESDIKKTIVASDQTLDFYLGFKLDGVTSYKNLSDTKDMIDFAKITYYVTEPEIEPREFEPFIPYSGQTITILVRAFTSYYNYFTS